MHVPVLLNEVIEGLNIKPGDTVIDGTVNSGGHAREMLGVVGVEGQLLGIDLDQKVISKLIDVWSAEFPNAVLAQGNYADMSDIMKRHSVKNASAILLDLGMSSDDLDESGRGFSFQKNEPLDMRYDPTGDFKTAAQIVNSYRSDELIKIFREYGDETRAIPIARAIVIQRKRSRIITTFDLVSVIETVVRPRKGQSHPATRVFQALRMEANTELQNVQRGISEAINVLVPGGRLAVISFHSIEDRLVKNTFRELSKEGTISIINKRPIVPGEREIAGNRRSRSAKLRIIQKNDSIQE